MKFIGRESRLIFPYSVKLKRKMGEANEWEGNRKMQMVKKEELHVHHIHIYPKQGK